MQWRWMKPDKPGLWFYTSIGVHETPPTSAARAAHRVVDDITKESYGWWCYVMPLFEFDTQESPSSKDILRQLRLKVATVKREMHISMSSACQNQANELLPVLTMIDELIKREGGLDD